jgi:hypothetical protein
MTVEIGTVVFSLLTGYSVVGTLAARSKAWVSSRSLAGIVGSNPAGGRTDVCRECCASSDSCHCVGPIVLPEEYYRVWSV